MCAGRGTGSNSVTYCSCRPRCATNTPTQSLKTSTHSDTATEGSAKTGGYLRSRIVGRSFSKLLSTKNGTCSYGGLCGEPCTQSTLHDRGEESTNQRVQCASSNSRANTGCESCKCEVCG